MQPAPIPSNEVERIEAVYLTELLDSDPEDRFDRITRVTQHLFKVPSSFVALVDKERVWFKSSCGSDAKESPRDMSFCGHAICSEVTNDPSSRIFEVVDTSKDIRFSDNPFITEVCKIRYYMGYVLQSPSKFNIGVYCIADTKPRELCNSDKKLFMDLGQIVQEEIDRGLPLSARNTNHFSANSLGENNPKEFTSKFLSISDQMKYTSQLINKSLQKHGVNFKEWRILNEIVETELLSPNIISQKLDMSAPLVSRYLESLELQGLIQRTTPEEGDKRFVQLECTDSGKDIWVKGLNFTYHEARSQFGNIFSNL